MNIEKCSIGGCEHTLESLHEETHEEGLCWKITKPELAEEQTNNKYCPCAVDKNFIRRYDRVGYIQQEKHDSMVTKPCAICLKDALFRVSDDVCMSCKTRADYDAE